MTTVGIVGAGNWGRNHVRIALKLRDEGLVDEVWVCDADPSRLTAWEGKAHTATDLRGLLAGRPEAAIVATPADTHHAVSRDLLRAGIHVLVEKPMTLLASEARDLVTEASRRDLVLMPGHIFRYHPAIAELRERIRNGRFGNLLFLNTVRTAFSPPRRDVGVLYSLGIHEADLYPHLLGVDSPLEAWAHVGGFVRAGIEGVASLAFRFGGGLEGFAFESWLSPGVAKQRRLTVVGTKGAAEVDYQDTRGFRTWETSTDPSDPKAFQEGKADTVSVAAVEPLRAEVEDFLRTVTGAGKHKPRVDGTAGLRAVEIIESLIAKGSFVRPRGP